MSRLNKYKEAAKNFKTVGTVTFSSRFLAKKMIKPIDFKKAKTIVEIGAGDGSITKLILKKIKPQTQVIAFEINPAFCQILRDLNHPQLRVIEDGAENLESYLPSHLEKGVDYIVSSVPLVVLSKDMGAQIMTAVRRMLSPKGKFIHLSYMPSLLKQFKRQFETVKLDFTPLNIPPAFVYSCKKRA